MFNPDQIGSLLALDRPAVLPAMLVLSTVVVWRHARPTGRALATAIVLQIFLHLAAWLVYGQSRPIQAICALVGLTLILPISVRSRRKYTLVLAGAALLSALAQFLATLLPIPQSDAVDLLAWFANGIMALALWAGFANDMRRPARSSGAPPFGTRGI